MRASFWLSGSYFWYLAGIGCFAPYAILYYRQLLLSGGEIGLLVAMGPLGMALLAPLWGWLADTYSAHRLILRSALLLSALIVCSLAFVTQFAAILPLLMLLAACASAIPSLLDGYAVTISAREGTSFGRLRVWGSIGFICGVWVVAQLMGAAISTLFLFMYALTLLLTFAATFGLPMMQPRALQRKQGIGELLKKRSVLVLLALAFLVTLSASVMGNYFSLYIVALGGDVQLISQASVVGTISELPILVFGAWLLSRFPSRSLLIVAVGFYVLRLGLYALPPDPIWVLAIQLLHGFSFGLYLNASVNLMHELSGPDYAATGQSLMNATAQGFGAITGSILSGVLLDLIGVVNLFRLAACGMLCALIIGLVFMRILQNRPKLA